MRRPILRIAIGLVAFLVLFWLVDGTWGAFKHTSTGGTTFPAPAP